MVWFLDEDGMPKSEPIAWLAFISLGVYMLSFVLPVAYLPGNRWLILGFHAFIYPYSVRGVAAMYWFANPAYWVGFWLLGKQRNRSAVIAALVAVAFGGLPRCLMSTLEFETHYMFWGAYWQIDSLEIGYYGWFLSFVLLLIAASATLCAERRS